MSSISTYFATDGSKIKLLAVGGTFDDNGGSMSGYFSKLMDSLHNICDHEMTCLNGGTYKDLLSLFYTEETYDYIIWMANVDNEKPKLLSQVKMKWPKAILAMSKANFDNKYTLMDLVHRALNAKANLIVEFKGEHKQVTAKVFDPLGNVFCDGDNDEIIDSPYELSRILFKRMQQLSAMTRQESVQDGPELPVPDQPVFFNIIRRHAETYHNLIHGANTSRMLGNVSFRCEKGFPSFRHNEVIYVSKRNMDKRMIGVEGFVAVDLDSADKVIYCGEAKPSVDAPIQLALYRKYPWVNYMLHSHVYIENTPFTERMIPCGAMQEVEEITKMIDNGKARHDNVFTWMPPSYETISLNLKGHGSLVMSDHPYGLSHIQYVARQFPERQTV
jgi:hypothetical protein